MLAVVRQAAEGLVAHPAGLVIEGLGSYRRGKADSGDLDVLISHLGPDKLTGPACTCSSDEKKRPRQGRRGCECGAGRFDILPPLIASLERSGFLLERMATEDPGGELNPTLGAAASNHAIALAHRLVLARRRVCVCVP
jgi:hypothetical protein